MVALTGEAINLESRVAVLEERLSRLEREHSFRDLVSADMSGSQIIDAWLRWHQVFQIAVLAWEADVTYKTINQAAWRLYKQGKLRRVGLGLYERAWMWRADARRKEQGH